MFELIAKPLLTAIATLAIVLGAMWLVGQYYACHSHDDYYQRLCRF
jgi:hypothetical protein